jgi:hypothetical protein
MTVGKPSERQLLGVTVEVVAVAGEVTMMAMLAVWVVVTTWY